MAELPARLAGIFERKAWVWKMRQSTLMNRYSEDCEYERTMKIIQEDELNIRQMLLYRPQTIRPLREPAPIGSKPYYSSPNPLPDPRETWYAESRQTGGFRPTTTSIPRKDAIHAMQAPQSDQIGHANCKLPCAPESNARNPVIRPNWPSAHQAWDDEKHYTPTSAVPSDTDMEPPESAQRYRSEDESSITRMAN
ncbi:hypothetical protein N7528_009215 [Penicillium herquei]|nr:hypothetical protein N7528_009215 [Penicillium herquei]